MHALFRLLFITGLLLGFASPTFACQPPPVPEYTHELPGGAMVFSMVRRHTKNEGYPVAGLYRNGRIPERIWEWTGGYIPQHHLQRGISDDGRYLVLERAGPAETDFVSIFKNGNRTHGFGLDVFIDSPDQIKWGLCGASNWIEHWDYDQGSGILSLESAARRRLTIDVARGAIVSKGQVRIMTVNGLLMLQDGTERTVFGIHRCESTDGVSRFELFSNFITYYPHADGMTDVPAFFSLDYFHHRHPDFDGNSPDSALNDLGIPLDQIESLNVSLDRTQGAYELTVQFRNNEVFEWKTHSADLELCARDQYDQVERFDLGQIRALQVTDYF